MSENPVARDRQRQVDVMFHFLRERMRLLQGDRRANIDILEANKAANKEEIRRLREDNKDLRVKIAQVQRSGAEETNQAAGGASHELVHMQGEVMKVRKGYDDARNIANKHRQVLSELKDEVRDLETGMVISIAELEKQQAESPPTASAFDLAAVSPPRRKLKAAAGAVAAASRLARKEDLRV